MSFNDNHPTIQCRACMCEKSEFQKFHMITDVEDGMKVYEIFKYITPDIVIQDCDGLPQYICVGCLFKLKQAFQFQEMCIESDRKYRGIDKKKEDIIDVSDFINDIGITATSSGCEASAPTTTQILNIEQTSFDGINNITEVNEILSDQPKTTLIASMKVKLTDQYFRGTSQDCAPPENDEKLNQNEAHVCTECKKAFGNRKLLLEHRRLHSDETQFLCPTCGKGFKKSAYLREHVLRHSENPRYQCPHCPRKFPCKSGVRQHQSTHSNTRNYVCEVCDSAFKRSDSLRGHMKRHTGKRPYKCDICPWTFITSNDLKQHKSTHTGEKPYKCEYCHRAFVQKNGLYKHLRIYLGEKVFICTQCKEAFKYFAELQEHKLRHQVETQKTFELETSETSQSEFVEDIIVKEETILSN